MSHTNMILGRWRADEWPEYVEVSHEGMREASRRYVPERTCKMEYEDEWSGDELYPTEAYSCSACGRMTLEGKPRYCPGCGAKVVE